MIKSKIVRNLSRDPVKMRFIITFPIVLSRKDFRVSGSSSSFRIRNKRCLGQ